jgi:hypothetical protein
LKSREIFALTTQDRRLVHLRIGSWFLSLTALTTGAVVLIIEIAGVRALTPYFGASHYVWTAQITVTLAALAGGYQLGGLVADRYASSPQFRRADRRAVKRLASALTRMDRRNTLMGQEVECCDEVCFIACRAFFLS